MAQDQSNSLVLKSPHIRLRGISKRFPGVVANDKINLDIYQSEIHALLGENGAGKSTLMKILYGFYTSDSGTIGLQGNIIDIASPAHARQAGIGMVFQDFTQIPAFSVLDNIALFLSDLQPIYKESDVEKRISAVSERYGLHVDPHAIVAQLSIGEQQKVEILKLLLSEAKVLVLDEPTRVLAPHEVDSLFEVLKVLRSDGYAIVFITHKLDEVLNNSDRITVLRNGKVAGSMLRPKATKKQLIELMFSKKLLDIQSKKKTRDTKNGKAILRLVGIETLAEGNETNLKNINLEIYPGEIVGVAGVSGNGQKELGDVILGMRKSKAGKKSILGKDMTNQSVGKIRQNGVGFIQENPLSMASIPFMTVLENMALTDTRRYSRNGGLRMDWTSVNSDYQATQEKLNFPFSLYSLPRSLSGGNLQRMVIVREMTHSPQLLIASYLTRGLDVQSTLAARKALLLACEKGAGVLLISEDLEELFDLSDRLVILFKGEITAEFVPSQTDIFEVGHLMTGSKLQSADSRNS